MINSPLLSLLQLCDPMLPIGGFSHSAGLETYVQAGIVVDRPTANQFIEAQLSQNIFYTDASFLSLAYDASLAGDLRTLLLLDQECTAVKMPSEIRVASQKLGLRLLKIFTSLGSPSFSSSYSISIRSGQADGHYAIAFATCAHDLGIEKHQMLTGFFYNAAAAMVTNCVKLIPLGQQEGQAILYGLHPLIENLAKRAMEPDRNLIGLCCAGFDIRSMQHERLYSRLYMS